MFLLVTKVPSLIQRAGILTQRVAKVVIVVVDKVQFRGFMFFGVACCTNVEQQQESIYHLFAGCEKVLDFWKNITIWFELKLSIKVKFSDIELIFGYQNYDQNFWPLNFILLIARQYIFHCSKYSHDINIYNLQKLVEEKYVEQYTLSKIKDTVHIFNRNWSHWKLLFESWKFEQTLINNFVVVVFVSLL